MGQAFAKRGITAENINELNPALYNGPRLLDCYILHGKHFFVSDQAIFRAIGGEYEYENQLKNDDWFIKFGHVMDYASPGDHFFTPYVEFSLWKPNPVTPALPTRVGWVYPHNTHTIPLSNYDRLCENGIVHDLNDLAALPGDVTK